MATIQTLLQTIWASVLNLGWFQVVIAVVVIALLTRANKLLGLLATILFIAYLSGWI